MYPGYVTMLLYKNEQILIIRLLLGKHAFERTAIMRKKYRIQRVAYMLAITLLCSCAKSFLPAKGIILSGKYTNESLKLSYALPSGWRFAQPEDIQNLNRNIELPEMGAAYKAESIYEIGTVYDMIAFDEITGCNVCVAISIADSSASEPAETFLDSIIAVLSQVESFEPGEKAPAKVGTNDYLRLACSFAIDGSSVLRNYYARMENGFIVCIMTTVSVDSTDTAIAAFDDFR